MIEIEVKARLDSDEAARVRQRLEALCGAGRPVDKSDTYFLPPPVGAGGTEGALSKRHIRVRLSEGRCWGTVKERAVRDGVECNREQEFGVDDGDAFCAALALLGFRVDIGKRKRGFAYRHRGALIEVVEVEGLGHFVEIELLLQEGEEGDGGEEGDASLARQREAETEARGRLLAMLGRLGVSRDAIEPRRYIDLLRLSSGGVASLTSR